MNETIKCMITGGLETRTGVVYNHCQNKTNFNSINNKKSCFVDEKDIDEVVVRSRLGKDHYNNKFQVEFDDKIEY